MAAGEAQARKSDLGVRTLTALFMLAVSGAAVWLGGWVWSLFVIAVALGVLWEWRGLVGLFEAHPFRRAMWNVAGLIYVGLAAMALEMLRNSVFSLASLVALLMAVIATDVGAYFAGRAIRGPKIAPRISPSKTWAGLGGGMLGAALVVYAWLAFSQYQMLRSIDFLILPANAPGIWQNIDWAGQLAVALPLGSAIAIVAQIGDFFESWMKRRAGVKDSGKLLPGHGGLFDRLDGLLAVLFVMSVAAIATISLTLASGGSLLPGQP